MTAVRPDMAAVPGVLTKQTRLAYLGTPEMSVPTLRALVGHGHHLDAVVTRADTRRGRGGDTAPSPVKLAAGELGLPVFHVVDDLLGRGIELGIVVAFGRLVRPHVLAEIPMVNLHFSLLPRWRGAAPVERALLAGDAVTGVCLMRLDEGLDTGPVYARTEIPIAPDATGASLRAELVEAGTSLLLDRLATGLGTAVPQRGPATYADKLSAADRRLDWRLPPGVLDRVIRLGGAWTTFRGRRMKVGAAEVVGSEPGDTLHGDRVGGLRLVVVQPDGKPSMAWAEYARGARPADGERFGA